MCRYFNRKILQENDLRLEEDSIKVDFKKVRFQLIQEGNERQGFVNTARNLGVP